MMVAIVEAKLSKVNFRYYYMSYSAIHSSISHHRNKVMLEMHHATDVANEAGLKWILYRVWQCNVR